MALFVKNGRVYKLVDTEILNKTWKEMECILYLSEAKSEVTHQWSEFMKKTLEDNK